jgi:glyoxylase-like metal-dependent hydrolase (beta-lactamase superfamily II)
MIVLGHGHADHFGGALYFQDHYGTHVSLTQADWDFMEHPPAAGGGAGKAPKTHAPTLPKQDSHGGALRRHDPDTWPDFRRRIGD